MTTPGGVPNLPAGALTLDTLAASTQDMSGDAMKSRAVARFPSIFDLSTGLSALSDLTPFGILTRIWAEVNSLIANADPADIQGPEDLPELVLEFIAGLPVVGQFVDILDAILGTYEGDDAVLLGIQSIFAPIRSLMQLISGIGSGFPLLDELTGGWSAILGNIGIGIQAQAQNIIQDNYINLLLNPGTLGGVDNFAVGAAGDPPDPTLWDLQYPAGSLGDIVLSGDGVLQWEKHGSGARLAQLRFLTALGTQKGLASLVTMSNIGHGALGVNPYFAITACGSSDNSDRIEARVDGNSAEIGYVIADTYTAFTTPTTYNLDTGGTWTLKYDVATRYIGLLHDNTPVVEITDSGNLAHWGIVGPDDYTANLFSGAAHFCGNSWIPFTVVFYQYPGPAWGSFVTYDTL